MHLQMHSVFPYLKHVDLTRCPHLQAGQITALQAFSNLTSLRAMLLDEGQMLAVAAEIAQLRSLTALDVSGYATPTCSFKTGPGLEMRKALQALQVQMILCSVSSST